MKPIARIDQISAEHVAGETIVYDLRRARAHCLNDTATAVWRYCDGNTPVAEMAGRLQHEFGLPPDESLVRIALKQLEYAKLVEGVPAEPLEALPSRREIGRKLAIATMAIPLVTSIVVPTPAAAQSYAGQGGNGGQGGRHGGGGGQGRKGGHGGGGGRGRN